VVGCTLGNLAEYCRGSGSVLKMTTFLAIVKKWLYPAGTSLQRSRGCDVSLLCTGFMTHRVLQIQGKRLLELKNVKAIDSRVGHVGIVVGACASILVCFACMVYTEPSVDFSAQFAASLRELVSIVLNWRVGDGLTFEYIQQIQAEARALERARAGVAWAQAKAVRDGFTVEESMQLQLLRFQRSAWPSNECLDAQNHAYVLEKIRYDELVSYESASTATVQNTVVPLSALPVAESSSINGTQRGGEGSVVSTESGSSSWSSWSSCSSNAGDVAASIGDADGFTDACSLFSASTLKLASVDSYRGWEFELDKRV
jgi:hypothetical protein